MTIKEEILRELRKGTPLAEIRRKYRGIGQLYEAVRKFLPEAEKKVKEMQTKLGKLKTDVSIKGEEFARINRQKKESSTELEELNRERVKLTKEVVFETEELNRLQAGKKELEKRGFTPRILKKIQKIEDRSASQVLFQLETVEKYQQIEKAVPMLEEKKASLEVAIHRLEAKKTKLGERVVSQRNKFDYLKLKTATVTDATTVVFSLLKAGYSIDDIKALKHGLIAVGIKDHPALSVTRLVRAIEKAKSLSALQDMETKTRTELAALRSEVIKTKAKLKARSQLTRSFKETKDVGVKSILDITELAKKKILDVTDVYEKHMTTSTSEFKAHIQSTMEEVRTGLGEWSDLQEKKGRLKEILHPAQVLLGMLESPEYLRQLPLTFVFQLFDRLRLWCEMNLKDAAIQPSQDIWRKDVNLNFIQTYRLPVLIEFVCEGLREIMVQQSRKE